MMEDDEFEEMPLEEIENTIVELFETYDSDGNGYLVGRSPARACAQWTHRLRSVREVTPQ